MDYYSAVKHRPDCPRCGHRMVHAVGSSIKGHQWIRWWCPECGEVREVRYPWPRCHACNVDEVPVLGDAGEVVGWHCPRCWQERRA